MPFNPDHCSYFLRFSAKVSGSHAGPVEQYIREVDGIARKHLGRRVRFWHDSLDFDDRYLPRYTWLDVHTADDQMRALGRQAEMAGDMTES